MKFELMQKGKRGRKPGSTRVKKVKPATAAEVFKEAQEKRLQELKENPEATKEILAQIKILKKKQYLSQAQEKKLIQAMRRSQILTGLIKEGKVKVMGYGNLIIQEAVGAHLKQYTILK